MAGKVKYDKVKLYAEWVQGNFKSIQEMARVKNVTYPALYRIIRVMEKKLLPNGKVEERAIEAAAAGIASKLVEASTRQADLGAKMQKRALEEVEEVKIADAGQLSSLAKAGVDIERRALGLKDEEKDEKIVIQMAVGINLGGAMVGGDGGTPIIEGEVVKKTDA